MTTSHDEMIRALSSMSVADLLDLTRALERRWSSSAVTVPSTPSTASAGHRRIDTSELWPVCFYCGQTFEEKPDEHLHFPWLLDPEEYRGAERWSLDAHPSCLLDWPERHSRLEMCFHRRHEHLARNGYWVLAHATTNWSVWVGGRVAPVYVAVLLAGALSSVRIPMRDWSSMSRENIVPPGMTSRESRIWHAVQPEIFREFPRMSELLQRTNWDARMRTHFAAQREAEASEEERKRAAMATQERLAVALSIALEQLKQGVLECPHCKLASGTHRPLPPRFVCASCGRSFTVE